MIQPFHGNREEEILNRARDGDRVAFAEMCERHRQRIWKIAMSVARRRVDAEDIAQIAIVRAFQALPTFRGETSFEAWLCRIALNEAHDFQKSAWRRRVLLWGQSKPDETPTVPSSGSRICAASTTSNSAQSEAEQRELQRRVRAAVAGLSERERVPIWLVYFEQFTIAEVARLEHVPESTIRSRVKVGLRKLERTLGDLEVPGGEPRQASHNSGNQTLTSTVAAHGQANEMAGIPT